MDLFYITMTRCTVCFQKCKWAQSIFHLYNYPFCSAVRFKIWCLEYKIYTNVYSNHFYVNMTTQRACSDPLEYVMPRTVLYSTVLYCTFDKCALQPSVMIVVLISSALLYLLLFVFFKHFQLIASNYAYRYLTVIEPYCTVGLHIPAWNAYVGRLQIYSSHCSSFVHILQWVPRHSKKHETTKHPWSWYTIDLIFLVSWQMRTVPLPSRK